MSSDVCSSDLQTRTQEMKMEKPFLDLKAYIWGEVYKEYLEVRK